MRYGQLVLELSGIALIFAVVLFFPVRYPIYSSEEDPDPTQTIALHRDRSIETIIAPSGTVSGIIFWSNQQVAVPPHTPLDVTVTSLHDGQEVIRVTAPFSTVYHEEDRTVRFRFSSLAGTPGQRYRVILRAPTVEPEKALPIRRLLPDAVRAPDAQNEVAYQLSSKRPFILGLSAYATASDTEGQDIYYYWRRGGRIAQGINPYACAVDDTCANHKTPQHLPLFYLLSAATHKLGLATYGDWIAVWQPSFLAFYLATTGITFTFLYYRGQHVLAFFSAFFWLFNRWSLYVVRVGHLDFMALFFLVLSIVLLKRYRRTAFLLLGVSLALKQVAIFLVPLYLIYVWYHAPARRRVALVSALLLIASVPVLTSLPFLIDNPQAMALALLFAATRSTEADLGAPGLAQILQVDSSFGTLFMLFLMGLVYVVTYRKQLSVTVGALLIFMTFLAFNNVLFHQYFVWVMPFVPLAASEYLLLKKRLPVDKV